MPPRASARLARRSAIEPAVAVEQRRVPRLGPSTRASSGARPRPSRPRARSRRPRRPSARPGSSSAGRRRRAGARASPRSTRKRAVSWLSRIVHEWRTPTTGRRRGTRASSRRSASPGSRGTPTGSSDEAVRGIGRELVAAQPGPDGAREAGVVHRAVPAADAEVGAGVVRRARRRRARRAGSAIAASRTPRATSGEDVDRAERPVMFATSMRQPSSVERRLEPAAHHRGAAPRTCARGAPRAGSRASGATARRPSTRSRAGARRRSRRTPRSGSSPLARGDEPLVARRRRGSS